MKVDPAKTWALVVGVGGYGHEAWDTEGPAEAAAGFRQFLIGQRKVPETQIEYLVSGAKRADGADLPARPTQERVGLSLQELRHRRGDLLVLFWSGHGAIDIDQRQRLFYADAIESNPLNLELESLLPALASTWCPGFKRQLIVVDACAVPMKAAFEFEQPGDRFAALDQSRTGQAVLFASRKLQTSRPGLFWDVLEPHLVPTTANQPGEWPDLAQLLEGVKGDFEERAAKQQPRLRLGDWTGEVAVNTSADVRISHLTRAERERVVELLKPVKLSDESVHRAYVEALGVISLESQAQEDLEGVVPRLSHLCLCQSPLPVLAFALGLLGVCDKPEVSQRLLDLAKAAAARLGVSDVRLDELAARVGAKPPEVATLLIQAPNDGGGSFQLTAWLWLGQGYEDEPAFPKDGDEEGPLSLDEVKRLVPELVLRTRRRLAPETSLLVELMVPYELLSMDFDAWPLPARALAPPTALGRDFAVVVRSLERAEGPEYRENWSMKCDLLKARAKERFADHARWIQDGDLTPAVLYQDLAASSDFCLGFVFSPVSDELWLKYSLGSGVPVILWLRESPEDSAIEQQRLCEELGETATEDLPKWILEVRKKRRVENLSLLWDDRERKLPDAPSRLSSGA